MNRFADKFILLRKLKLSNIHSLRQRILFMMITGIAVWCLVLFVFYSYLIRGVEHNRIEKVMNSDLYHIADQMESSYFELLSMSQQMMSAGQIGRGFNKYLSVTEHYEKIQEAEDITTNINTMAFSHPKATLLGYVKLNEKNEIVNSEFATMPIRKTEPRSLSALINIGALTFQGIHMTLNALSDRNVISVLRGAKMFDGDYLVYIEQVDNSAQMIADISSLRNIPYIFSLLDENGIVCFSTDKTHIPEGAKIGLQSAGKLGELGKYRYVIIKSKFGFFYMLAVPYTAYFKEEYQWQFGTIFILAMGISCIILILFLVYHFIYKPALFLGRELEKVKTGAPETLLYHTNIDEFDDFMFLFSDMKKNVSSLEINLKKEEYECRQLELEKLFYQINPHFLMNALNSLHWMALKNHQKEIDDYVYHLNYILGYSLGKIEKSATFRTEIVSLEMYIELQKKRYNFNVWLDIRIDAYLDCPCARLILQPLVENAVCHNMDDFGNLWVTMTTNGREIVIVIADDGRGISQLSSEGPVEISSCRMNKGIGLRYVQLSLKQFYGDASVFEIQSEADKGTTVKLVLPVIQQEPQNA
jgi:two-component system, sensor histidine kinase YesM